MCAGKRENSLPAGRKNSKSFNRWPKKSWAKWLFAVTGLAAMIWFLIRVLPKPSRATYPCQRAAFPLASAFIAYILGLFGTAVAFRKAKRHIRQSRFVLAGICIIVGLASAWLTIGVNLNQVIAEEATAKKAADKPFVPIDPPNKPMGVAKGIFPGRVVWVHDPDATNWNSAWNERTDIFYWDEKYTNPVVVERMMSSALCCLTGEKTDKGVWDALFKYFNRTHNKGDVGYTKGEKIVIKPNLVEGRRHNDYDNYADLSPQILLGLLKQLVQQAGVPQNCITVCESSRYISDKFIDRCYALFPNVTYAETNYYDEAGFNDVNTDPRRPAVKPTEKDMIFYSGVNIKNDNKPIPNDKLPVPFVEADYAINLAIMKPHGSAVITLCGKNWYGCFCRKPGSQEKRSNAHHYLSAGRLREYGQYRVLVDLMGHEHLGGKTMLFIVDGLWGFPGPHGEGSEPKKWDCPPFNGDYPSSIFMSQDHVAIDSVGFDFLRTEFVDKMVGAPDDYLHEAALADKPPSGTFYDPHRPIGHPKAARLASLGVHEHWNNHIDKKYSRNLGKGEGIELVKCGTAAAKSNIEDRKVGKGG
jgi:hypothetical protein